MITIINKIIEWIIQFIIESYIDITFKYVIDSNNADINKHPVSFAFSFSFS